MEKQVKLLAGRLPYETGSYSSRMLPDGTQEITFVKVAGEKGADEITRGITTSGEIATRLVQVAPAQLEATRLARQLLAGDPLTPQQIIAQAGPIEAALKQLEPFARKSQEALRRCLDLRPVPHPRVPLGF